MKRSIVLTLISLSIAVCSYGAELGIKPDSCPDVVVKIPDACRTPSNWNAATKCLDALVLEQPNVFPGAAMGYQKDGCRMKVHAAGPGFVNDSVVSLASVTKPPVYTAFVKLVQDHFASPSCTPMTSKCVFPQKFETLLTVALGRIDEQRGTDLLTQYNRIAFDDGAQQRAWKSRMKIRDLAQMTSGFPPAMFTGYFFCLDGDCPGQTANDVTCNPNDPNEPRPCRYAYLYNQYLHRRAPNTPIRNGCRPRTLNGPRLFPFDTYYHGIVDGINRVPRQFERRYSFTPGLLGECVFVQDAIGPRWVDARAAHERDIAKFYLGMPLMSEPGTQFFYAQPNVYVTALLIESVSQMRFDDYVRAQIFTPLGMKDTSFVIQPGTTQFHRLADLRRVPRQPARVLPDIPAPLKLDAAIYGADKNWDEPRRGWENHWPEGGLYSTATDLLRFLRFIRTGKAPDGRVLLNAESLNLITRTVGPVGTRTYAFNSGQPGGIGHNGYFGTLMRRNLDKGFNLTVLPQIITEAPDYDPNHVRLCDYQYWDVTDLRGALIRMIEGISEPCEAEAPGEP